MVRWQGARDGLMPPGEMSMARHARCQAPMGPHGGCTVNRGQHVQMVAAPNPCAPRVRRSVWEGAR